MTADTRLVSYAMFTGRTQRDRNHGPHDGVVRKDTARTEQVAETGGYRSQDDIVHRAAERAAGSLDLIKIGL